MDPDVATSSSSSSSLSSSTNPNRNHLSMSSSSSNHHNHQDHHQYHQSSSRYGCGSCCYPHRDQKDHNCLCRWPLLHRLSQWWNWTLNCCTAPAKVENSSMDSPAAQVCKVPPSEQSMDGSETPYTPRGEEELLARSHLRKFSYSDLRVATRNFRPDSLLGEGGFGCVFKGWVDEYGTSPVKPGTGLTVAVKTLNKNSLQGHNEWLAEVYYLSQLHHPNLVKLIGFCIENDQRLLVYEFMQRGSLENHLFRRGAMPLSWETRMKVARGAAEGLAFLHGRKKAVIYRDFKASNILLDVDYNSKLSDFGLAKDGPEGDKSHVSTRVMGTYGYAAPEYVMTGHLTARSDVYSFGVVLLEILTGKRSVDKSRPSGEHNLVEWARPYFSEKKKVFRLIDPRLAHYSEKGAYKGAQLAFQCLSRDPRARPTMHDVVETLGQIQNLKDITDNPHYQPTPDSRSSRASRA